MASPLPPEEETSYEQSFSALTPAQQAEIMAALEAAKTFDVGAYQKDYQNTMAKFQAAKDAGLAAAQKTGLSDWYEPVNVPDQFAVQAMDKLGLIPSSYDYTPVFSVKGDTDYEKFNFAPIPGQEYRLVDNNTGNVLAVAKTPEEAKKLAEAANSASKSQGSGANWAIQTQGSWSDGKGNMTSGWSDVYKNEKTPLFDNEMKLIAAAMLAATTAGALQPGGFGGLGAGGAGGAGAGGAGAAGAGIGADLAPGALSGLSFGPVASTAVPAGVTAGGLAAGTAAGLGGSTAGIEALAPITVTAGGTNFVLPSVAAALGAGAALPSLTSATSAPSTSATNNLTRNEFGSNVTPEGDIVLTANTASPYAVPAMGTLGAGATLPSLLSDTTTAPSDSLKKNEFGSNTTPEGDIVVTHTPTNILPAALGVGTAGGAIALADLAANANAANALDATTSASDLASSRVTPTAAETAALNAGAGAGGVLGTGLTAKEILAGLTAINALSNAVSGSGSGTGTGAGTGKFQDIFTKKLPTPGEDGALMVGGLKGKTKGAAGTFSARPTTDWYRFGMGPAMDIPAGTDLSGATSPYAAFGPGTLGQETFKAVSGTPEQPTGKSHGGSMGYARGSSRDSFAVEGPGTGRSDDIPAVLSDGEYVIDAETVALLGDGSSKAGAKKLDQMRVNIRKHKGRNLAKGKFSVNAKRPEKYLSGGRA